MIQVLAILFSVTSKGLHFKPRFNIRSCILPLHLALYYASYSKQWLKWVKLEFYKMELLTLHFHCIFLRNFFFPTKSDLLFLSYNENLDFSSRSMLSELLNSKTVFIFCLWQVMKDVSLSDLESGAPKNSKKEPRGTSRTICQGEEAHSLKNKLILGSVDK